MGVHSASYANQRQQINPFQQTAGTQRAGGAQFSGQTNPVQQVQGAGGSANIQPHNLNRPAPPEGVGSRLNLSF